MPDAGTAAYSCINAEAAEAWQEYLMSETLAEDLRFGTASGFETELEGGKAYLERVEVVSHN